MQHLDEGHVGVHDVEAVLLYERAHQLDAPGVSRNLRTMTHGIGGCLRGNTCRWHAYADDWAPKELCVSGQPTGRHLQV